MKKVIAVDNTSIVIKGDKVAILAIDILPTEERLSLANWAKDNIAKIEGIGYTKYNFKAIVSKGYLILKLNNKYGVYAYLKVKVEDLILPTNPSWINKKIVKYRKCS